MKFTQCTGPGLVDQVAAYQVAVPGLNATCGEVTAQAATVTDPRWGRGVSLGVDDIDRELARAVLAAICVRVTTMPPLSVPRGAGRPQLAGCPCRPELAGSGDGPQGDQGPVARRGGGAPPLAAGCGPAGDAGPHSRRGDGGAVAFAGPVFPCHWPRLGGLRMVTLCPMPGCRVLLLAVVLPRRRARGRGPCCGGGRGRRWRAAAAGRGRRSRAR